MLHFLHRGFQYIAPYIGASPDELKLITSFLLSYPLAAILKRIPDSRPGLKNAFIIGISTFYLVGLFDLWDGLRTLVISAGGAYTIASLMRKSPFMPWIGFVFLMGHLSINHFSRLSADEPGAVDITGAQMVMLMKLNAFCWNVADGQLPADQLSAFQRDRMLPELPPLLDFAAYVLFFPSLFAGPSFDFVEYRRWIDTSMFAVPSHVEPSKRPPVRRKRKIPRSGTPAAWKAASGLFWLACFIYLSGHYGPAQLLAPSFTGLGFWRRMAFLYMVPLTARCKYYGVWSLTEGACILTGLGYNGVDPATGRVSWDRLRNIDPWVVETAQNVKSYLAGWNMNTNNWLRNYVYLRVTPRGKKPGFRASLITFGTSALWHGFNPGYYLTFIVASFIQSVAKNVRRYVRPFFLDPQTGGPGPHKKLYDAVSFIVTQLTFSFVTAPFLVLSFRGSLEVWTRMYFYPLIPTALAIAFFASPGKALLRRKLEERQGGGRLKRTVSQDSVTGREPVYGLMSDPQKEITELVEEIQQEMKEKKT